MTDSFVEALTAGYISEKTEASENYRPRLISNRATERFQDTLISEIGNSSEFTWSVAFITSGALSTLKEQLKQFAEVDGSDSGGKSGTASSHRGTIITSTFSRFNKPDVFKNLLHLEKALAPALDVRIWQSGTNSEGEALSEIDDYRLHAKGYIFKHPAASKEAGNGATDTNDVLSIFVGSSNLTESALLKNREWNLKVSSLEDGEIAHQVRRELATQMSESVPLTEEWIKEYERDYELNAPQFIPSTPHGGAAGTEAGTPAKAIEPNQMQSEALTALQTLRSQGENRAIVISATGTGKTYLSAFDVRKAKPKRMLYIVHQQQILKKAIESFKKVLGRPDSDFGLLSGDSKQSDRPFVFATIQTVSRPDILESFAKDAFDYILIDEVHHSGASTYQRIIDYFTPKFLLGMTATPERIDGFNIFELFDNNIAYEIRLQRALEENMLVPFHYFGVAEYLGSETDDEGDLISLSAASEGLSYEISQLASTDRVRYIIDKIQYYGDAASAVRGIVFCSSIEEATKLSALFNQEYNQYSERPYRTIALTGRNTQEERDAAIETLETGKLDYILTVDLFNEGIDIPSLNQIVMLRQTESSIIFTQQLGRGLRKFSNKSFVTVIDFIGNYANNYLIPLALYGNKGDRDITRKDFERTSIGLSSISFDRIAQERVLKAIDVANLSSAKLVDKEYQNLRYQLNAIPMLKDFFTRGSLLPTVVAQSGNSSDYLSFVAKHERRLQQREGPSGAITPAAQLTQAEAIAPAVMKYLTEIILPGLRPQESVILGILLGMRTAEFDLMAFSAGMGTATVTVSQAMAAITDYFPQASNTVPALKSAIRTLTLGYFMQSNRKKYGEALIMVSHDASGRKLLSLSPVFVSILRSNEIVKRFVLDAIETSLLICRALFRDAQLSDATIDRNLIVGNKYSTFQIMRLCEWSGEMNAQNLGGYGINRPSSSMPVLIKYGTSQYEDRFLNPQEISWFSKGGRSTNSPEFQWLRDATVPHFIPVFVRRTVDETQNAEKSYYYIGTASVHGSVDTHQVSAGDNNATGGNTDRNNQTGVNSGSSPRKIVLSTLHLDAPLEPSFYKHLTGESAY